MEDDLQSAGLSRERVALFVGPRCLSRPDPPPLFRVTNTPPLKLNKLTYKILCNFLYRTKRGLIGVWTGSSSSLSLHVAISSVVYRELALFGG